MGGEVEKSFREKEKKVCKLPKKKLTNCFAGQGPRGLEDGNGIFLNSDPGIINTNTNQYQLVIAGITV